MLIFNFPFIYYDFVNTQTDIAPFSADFTNEFYSNYFDILSDIYLQEYFGKETKNYTIVNDIFLLHYVLVKIHLIILNTAQEDRKTYGEYLKDYHGDCIFKRLTCKGINVKPLMIAFDSGYSNINNIPTIITPSGTDYIGGISWFGISGDEELNNDFIID